MPNWMKGTLRVRGTWEGVRRFLINALEPLGDAMPIQINEGSVSGAGGPYHIEGTERGNVVDDFWTEDDNTGDIVSMLEAEFAWGVEVEALQKLCKKYDVDMRFYGFESSGEVNQDVEIIDEEITKNKIIQFENYQWDCICPLMGG